MKSLKSLLVLSIVLIFVSTVSCPLFGTPNKIKLEYKYKMGDVVNYKVTLNGDTSMAVKGKKASEKVKVDMRLSMKVLHVSKEGNIDLQISLTKADVRTKKSKKIDLRNQIGKTVYSTMKPNGEILGMTSFDKNFDPNSVSVPFPDKPIGVGYSWKNSVKASNQVPIPLDMKYTLEKIKRYRGRSVAVIKEEISVPASEKKHGIIARSVGMLYFDYKKGIIVRNHLKTKMTMVQNLRNDDPKFGPPVKRVVTKVKMSTKMELID